MTTIIVENIKLTNNSNDNNNQSPIDNDLESYILVTKQQNKVSSPKSTRSNGSSIGGWSAISMPSVHSFKSIHELNMPKAKPKPLQSSSSNKTNQTLFAGTYLMNSKITHPRVHLKSEQEPVSKEFEVIANSDPSYSVTEEIVPANNNNDSAIDLPEPPAANNDDSMQDSVCSARVPFSWAEITKIQPHFHNITNTTHRPKIFVKPRKIETRNAVPVEVSDENSLKAKAKKTASGSPKVEPVPGSPPLKLPGIPEAEMNLNYSKADFTRKVRRSNRKGGYKYKSKYGNKRGSKRNSKFRHR